MFDKEVVELDLLVVFVIFDNDLFVVVKMAAEQMMDVLVVD